MSLKEVIQEARLNKNLKQEDTAKLLKVTVQTYSKWENGKTEPKASQIQMLSKILDISADEICAGKINKKIDIIEFMRKTSKLKNNLPNFDQEVAVYESIRSHEEYFAKLSDLHKEYEKMPPQVREDALYEEHIEKEYLEANKR